MNKRPIILAESKEAAQYLTNIKGWVDRNGKYFGEDESVARYSGSTHILCDDCQTPTLKNYYIICKSCRNKKAIEKYNARPKLEWNGETPIYSESHDEYFYNEDYLIEYIKDNMCTIEILRLVVCEPNSYPEVEAEYFNDALTEYGEITDEIRNGLDALNKILRSQPTPSWSPGEYAAVYDYEMD